METTEDIERKAYRMYAHRNTMEQVTEMLKANSYDTETADRLALQYKTDYLQLRKEQRRKLRKSVESDKIIGILSFIVSVLGTGITYLFIERFYVLFWGALLTGVIFTVKSFLNQREVEKIEEELNE